VRRLVSFVSAPLPPSDSEACPVLDRQIRLILAFQMRDGLTYDLQIHARFYPPDFSDSDIALLDLQLEAFVADVRSDIYVSGYVTLSALALNNVWWIYQ
jgi:hypothetical protein